MPPNHVHHRKPSPSPGGRWLLAVTGIVTALIGALFVWLMLRSFLRAREMRAWPEVECTILSSEIAQRRHDPYSPVEYQHQVTYGYTFKDLRLTSNRISLRGSKWSSKPQNAEESLRTYPPGSTSRCHVNPDQPGLAVLKPDSLAPGYSIWFPALFVIGGLGMTVRAALPGRGVAE